MLDSISGIELAAEAVRDVFRRANLLHYINVTPYEHNGQDALRVVYAGWFNKWGSFIEHGQADLKPEDRVRLSRAFRKVGIDATEYVLASHKAGNMPFVEIVPFTAQTPTDLHLVSTGYINPYRVFINRPSAAFFIDHGDTLAAELKSRFSQPALHV
ncbi:MAG: hypothetical protein KGQ41_04755 [Alphaproteobacteria bacterium]|nr:hypothetical protein [Alphaproteobacteria bacterium]